MLKEIRKLPLLRSVARYVRQRRDASRVRRDFVVFQSMMLPTDERFSLDWNERRLCTKDRTKGHAFDRHYVYHTAWAARVLSQTRPTRHIDVSSSVYFCSIVSAFVPIESYDFRPARLELSGLSCGQADLNSLPFADESLESVSSMHVVEHIGLGRYGDPLDPEGDLKAMGELKRVLAPGGNLLLVVPVGRPRICFNAHRIYAFRQILEAFSDLKLSQFALIADSREGGGLLIDAAEELADRQSYACGCFWFQRE